MAQVLHGCAKTTRAIRREIQNSDESLTVLSARYGINRRTVAKWRKRDYDHDTPMGPQDSCLKVLSRIDEAVCVGFRRHTRLPLDDCLYSLQTVIPHLTRTTLWRCYRDHDINRLPEEDGGKGRRQKFKDCPIGNIQIDMEQVRSGEGVLQLFVGIDCTCKLVYARLYENGTKAVAADFLRDLIAWVPYRIHTILTDKDAQFANSTRCRDAPVHVFDRICRENHIEHRLTKVNHPWTIGQVERMNRTLKEATAKRCHYESHEQLRDHLNRFLDAYNLAKRLKSLRGRTPCEEMMNWWRKDRERFFMKPDHFKMKLDNY